MQRERTHQSVLGIVFSFLKRIYQSLTNQIYRAIPQTLMEGPLSDLQKAAVFFLTLAPASSSKLINNLSSHEIRNIGREMQQLSYVTPETQKEVVQELCGLLVDDGEFPTGALPTPELLQELVVKDPKRIMTFLRRHWLVVPLSYAHSPSKELTTKPGPGERAAIFLSHLPAPFIKKLLPQLSADEVGRIGEGMLRISLLSDESKHHLWNELSRQLKGSLDDQDSILKLFHHLLHDEGLPEQAIQLDPFEKTTVLLRLLKPRTCHEMGQKLLALVDRSDQEGLILALRQSQENSEKEKGGVLQEFFAFLKSSLISRGALEEHELLEEIERISLHMPLQVARCLEAHWLYPKSLLSEWRELAEKNPAFVAQKLTAFLHQDQSSKETLTNFQKAALFLRLIHPEIRAEILKDIHENQNQFLVPEINRQWRITPEEKRRILEEFLGQYYFLSTAKLLEKSNSGN